MKIKKGDEVLIIRGKDRGRKGKVIKILPKENKVIVEGLNLVKKHIKPKRQGEKGKIIEIPRLIYASNVMLVCPYCQKRTRVGYKFENQEKYRYCKKCQSVIK